VIHSFQQTSNANAKTMPKSSTANIAGHIEQLPLELFEPILENLSLRDVIALVKHAGEDSRLVAALAISPKWRDIWSTYQANPDGFQTLVSLIVPIGGKRLFDPTLGALEVTPGQYYRRLAREREIHGPKYNFFDYVVRKTSNTIQNLLSNVDHVTLAFLSQRVTLDDIAVICPWLKTLVNIARQRHPDVRNKSIQVVRDRFHEALEGSCRCVVDPFGGARMIRPRGFETPGVKSCLVKHPDRGTSQWTISQIKAFVDAYSVVQTQLNLMKAAQLQDLAKLYARHHSRLKEPYAPQGPRNNPRHIPNQLEGVSRFVTRIIDLDRDSQPRSKQGMSKFRYLHPCLIPYDWCLRLWIKVGKTNPHLRETMQSTISESSEDALEDLMKQLSLSPTAPKPPDEVLSQIQVVNQGIRTFYKRSKKWGQTGSALPRIRIVNSDSKYHISPLSLRLTLCYR